MKNLNTKNKKWLIVYEEIKKKIESGEYEGKRILLRDVIEDFGVSDITARKVFSELKKEGLIYSTPKRGTIVLSKRKVEDVYIIVRDESLIYKDPLNTQLFTKIVSGFDRSVLSKIFKKHIFSLDFLLSHRKQFEGRKIVILAEAILKIEKDKVEIDNEKIEKIKGFEPVIIHSFGKIEGFNVVGTDYYGAFYNAVNYLFKKGHRRIGFVSGNINFCWFYPRFCGYIDSLKDLGLEIIPEIIKVTSGKNPEEEKKAMEEIMKSEKRPTAILCGNDIRAINVLNYCKERGIKVPEDISIIGFDNIDETKFTNPPLTTIDSKLELQGDAALKIFMKREEGEKAEDVFIKSEIIERETVKEVM